ncbi:ATP-binding cassette domain-containing protein [Candidatus Pelagibacter ubique]|nr:ATP-binding cassette domain-containing protein [Candidatus Pelagibacter ubique]
MKKKKHFFYISETNIPSTSANSIHVAKMIEASSDRDYISNLIVPYCDSISNYKKFYNIRGKINVISIFKKKININFFYRIIFSLKILLFLKKKKNNCIVSRSVITSLILSANKIVNVVEIHHKLNGMTNLIFKLINKRINHYINFILIHKNLKKVLNLSGKNIIERSSLNFKKGNLYGFVGRSGSGKTTFFDILMGLLKASSGDFFIDEKKIKVFNNYNWQSMISYVPQNAILTDGTFLENICYGNDLNKINNKHLLDCAEKAECLEFIKSREHGFETYIGEGGAKISGGQRQRILIARALYSNKPILLLDEATNALDKDKENKIFKNLTTLKDNKIIIAIAHNDQIKKFFDIIYKFDEKNIITDN